MKLGNWVLPFRCQLRRNSEMGSWILGWRNEIYFQKKKKKYIGYQKVQIKEHTKIWQIIIVTIINSRQFPPTAWSDFEGYLHFVVLNFVLMLYFDIFFKKYGCNN